MNILYAMLVTDAETGEIIEVNTAAENLYGYLQTELAGKPYTMLIANPESVEPKVNVRPAEGKQNPQVFMSRRKSGTLFLTESHTCAATVAGRRVICWMIRDKSAETTEENFLRDSEFRYRELFENMKSAVAVYEAIEEGKDFLIRNFNRMAEQIERLPREKVIGRKLSEVFPGAQKMGIFEVLRRVWRTGNPEYLNEAVYEDFRTTPSCRDNFVCRLPTGEVVAVYEDVTDRVRGQENILASEERFRLVFEHAPDAIYLCDFNGVMIDGNRAAETMIGYEKKDLIGKSFITAKLLVPEDIPKALIMLGKAARGLATGPDELTLKRADGRLVSVEIRTFPAKLRGEPLLLGIARDISERKRADELKFLFRRLLDQSRDSIFLIEFRTARFLDINDTACKTLGYEREDLLKMRVFDIQKGIPHERAWKEYTEKSIRQKNLMVEETYCRKDGTEFPVQVSLGHICLDREYMIAVARDMSEWKESEHKQKLWRAFVDQSTDAFYLIDCESADILDTNHAAEVQLGYTRERILGLKITDIETTFAGDDSWRKHIAELKKKKHLTFESKCRRADATVFPVEVSAGHLMMDKEYKMAIVRDITVRKDTEVRMHEHVRELENFYKAAIDRENILVELKKQVNQLSRELGLPEPHDLSFLDKETSL